jgi:hypothetical protein
MLPDRSKRYAGNDGEIPRLLLATNWQLLLVAMLVLVLLAVIFPRKSLVQKLYEQATLDELTVSYIQNLYRANISNADAAILLAKSQRGTLDIQSMEGMLLPLVDAGDARQRAEIRILLANGYQKALASTLDAQERARLKTRMTELMKTALGEDIPKSLARLFAATAFEFDLPRMGLDFLAKIEGSDAKDALEKYAQEALGDGAYGVAAEYFLMARDQATNVDDARRLFQRGISTHMAASRFSQAMLSAEQHLGNLEADPQTLRYLARNALAAGYPDLAAGYVRRLVFQPHNSSVTP